LTNGNSGRKEKGELTAILKGGREGKTPPESLLPEKEKRERAPQGLQKWGSFARRDRRPHYLTYESGEVYFS